MSADSTPPGSPPSSDAEQERGTPAWWNNRYLSGETPWDTGIVPPELQEIVSSGVLASGWALDLGCGSGLNARYLARHGFRVVGMDLALTPLVRGAQAAASEGLPVYLILGDVTAHPLADLLAAFALDIGCFHAVPSERRADYVAALAGRLRRGGYYLLYAFEPWEAAEGGPRGIGPVELTLFATHFALRWARHGFDGDRPSAWYLFRRI